VLVPGSMHWRMPLVCRDLDHYRLLISAEISIITAC
jgi:hypothetical protein